MLRQYRKLRSRYNEVLVNGSQWNAAVCATRCPVWAFVYPDTADCASVPTCRTKTAEQWENYNALTGCNAPLLSFDTSTRYFPFKEDIFVQLEKQVVESQAAQHEIER